MWPCSHVDVWRHYIIALSESTCSKKNRGWIKIFIYCGFSRESEEKKRFCMTRNYKLTNLKKSVILSSFNLFLFFLSLYLFGSSVLLALVLLLFPYFLCSLFLPFLLLRVLLLMTVIVHEEWFELVIFDVVAGWMMMSDFLTRSSCFATCTPFSIYFFLSGCAWWSWSFLLVCCTIC